MVNTMKGLSSEQIKELGNPEENAEPVELTFSKAEFAFKARAFLRQCHTSDDGDLDWQNYFRDLGMMLDMLEAIFPTAKANPIKQPKSLKG